MAETGETEPLLQPENSLESARDSESFRQPESSSSKHALRVIVLIATVTLISDLAGYAAVAPQLQLFEEIICRQYYTTIGALSAHDQLDQELCKIEPVQSELALINGWTDTFQTIPGLLLALPHGALADRIGRKPILLLGMTGCILGECWTRIVCWFAPRIPLRAVWFSAMSQLIGGGPQTATSLMWVMIADSCSVERRTTAFSQLSAAVLISEIVATPASAMLMSFSPWLPYLISFGMYFVGYFIAFWVPETLQMDKVDDQSRLSSSNGDEPGYKYVLRKILSEFKKFQESLRLVRQNSNVTLILVCFFSSYLGKQAIPLILQYGPKKFHWTIGQTSYLLSLRGSVNLFLLLVLLPAISEFLGLRLKLNPAVRDKYLTQASTALLFIGSTLMFFGWSPLIFTLGLVICALGSSFQITARSLVTSLVDKNLLGTVYTAIATVTSGGMVIAGPLLAYTFKWGMLLGNTWLGLPFLTAAGLYAIGFLSISFTKLTRPSH